MWVRRWTLLFLLALSIGLCSAAAAARQVHEVKRGDTLSGIAKQYDTSVKELCRANRIKKTAVLRIGQRLSIPGSSKGGGGKGVKSGKSGKSKQLRIERYTVKKGDTLIGIARRHATTVKTLRALNGLKRKQVIRVGQSLKVPAAGSGPPPKDKRAPKADSGKKTQKSRSGDDGPGVLTVAGSAVYYHPPTGRGRKTMKPVLMYLHGRGASPKQDCQRWAKLASHLGWVVCPSGQVDKGGGRRAWANNWLFGRALALATIKALRDEFGRRVQLYGNTLIGFSEGAFVAMNVGVREARTFNRWLILAGDDKYWGQPGRQALSSSRRRVRRVQLVTGKDDSTYDGTLEVQKALRKAGVPVRTKTPDMGHALPLERRSALYRSALAWLVQGR